MEGGREKEEEQDGVSVHSPCKAPPSSASSLPKANVKLSNLRATSVVQITYMWRASPLCPLWSDGIPEEKPGPAFFSRRGSAVARSFLQLGSAGNLPVL
ncbi:hypothetical protein Goshw_015708 [Gossypium schwendimanii]|uniref:Uncharacterized protein n=1 Tax=Gossypium schwendimanii TaxID=34291 RepID=A0A7J9MTA0_GOSSC|nr:hypothetical protein [Gossypium schwendimanii]